MNAFDYLVEVASEAEVRGLAPDHQSLAQLKVRGAMVTSRADKGRPYDFVSRFFAPGSGVDEDPVTGSAHCALAPYWRAAIGRDAMVGYQASRRGGTVHVRCDKDRVHLGGQAVTVLRAMLV
jgi:predicted PhzF superfamily epimerase YddE/YHI9